MKGLQKILALGVLVLAPNTLLNSLNAEQINGQLDIEDHVGSYATSASIRNSDSPGISDMFDSSYDLDLPAVSGGWPGMYSNISQFDSVHPKLVRDYRLTSTIHDTFDLELIYNGNVSNSKSNYFIFSFPTSDIFGNESITLQQTNSSGNLIGSSYDVRSIIAGTLQGYLPDGITPLNPRAGRFNMKNLDAGSYDVDHPYAHYQVTINNSIPEAGTISLLAIAGAASSIGYFATRKK